jgi:hypothetical protein
MPCFAAARADVCLFVPFRCGLRYARSRAKKEGGTTRRRKDKVLAAMSNKSDQPSPALTPLSIPFNGMRRASGYDENSLDSSQGSDGYTHLDHAPPHASQMHGQNGMTPSPPPSGSQGFMGYSQHSEHQQHHTPQVERAQTHYTQPFYTLPTPLSATMHHGSPPGSLPRLNAMTGMPYSHRMSNSPPSPMPANHFAQPSSYERERHLSKDRERMVLPPTPVSADPRTVPGKY